MRRHTQKLIGNKLRVSRKLAGLNQKEVCSRLGFKSAARLAKWEQGKSFPSTINLLKLSALYSTLANDLYFELYLRFKEEYHSQKPHIIFKKEEDHE